MKNIREGNLYNIETEISGTINPSESGLEAWKKEVRKQLLQSLLRQKTPNIENAIAAIFGETLE